MIENVTYLQDLLVTSTMRALALGAGHALIEDVWVAADRANAPSVYLQTEEFNADARRPCDRVGRITPFIRFDRPHPFVFV